MIRTRGKSVYLNTILPPPQDIFSAEESKNRCLNTKRQTAKRTLNSWHYLSLSLSLSPLFPFSTWIRCAFIQLWYKFHSMEKLIENVCFISCVLLIFTEHLRYDESKTNFDSTHSTSQNMATNENEICRAAWQLAWENNTFYSIGWHF